MHSRPVGPLLASLTLFVACSTSSVGAVTIRDLVAQTAWMRSVPSWRMSVSTKYAEPLDDVHPVAGVERRSDLWTEIVRKGPKALTKGIRTVTQGVESTGRRTVAFDGKVSTEVYGTKQSDGRWEAQVVRSPGDIHPASNVFDQTFCVDRVLLPDALAAGDFKIAASDAATIEVEGPGPSEQSFSRLWLDRAHGYLIVRQQRLHEREILESHEVAAFGKEAGYDYPKASKMVLNVSPGVRLTADDTVTSCKVGDVKDSEFDILPKGVSYTLRDNGEGALYTVGKDGTRDLHDYVGRTGLTPNRPPYGMLLIGGGALMTVGLLGRVRSRLGGSA